MRFFYHNEGNPRMDYVNRILVQPMLFAPAAYIKAASFAYFYSAGPRKLSECLSIPVTLADAPSADRIHTELRPKSGDVNGDMVTSKKLINQWHERFAGDCTSADRPTVSRSISGLTPSTVIKDAL